MVNTERAYLPKNMMEGASENDADELRRILDRFEVLHSYWSPIHDAGREDDRFLAGEQWDPKIVEKRAEDGRPCLTYNLLPAFARQITNKVRQERPQLRVKPVESDRGQTPDVTNVQGTHDYSLADVYMGLVRNIEHVSRAAQAYDKALADAVHHGFGFFGLNTRFSRHDPFVQEIVVERFRDSYAVLMDPSAQAADFSDSQDAFVLGMLSRSAFEAQYPGARSSSFGLAEGELLDGWFDSENITVATYYWIEWRDDEVLRMNTGKIHYLSDVEDVLDEMKEKSGVYIEKDPHDLNGRGEPKELRRKVKRPFVMWRKLTGVELLGDAVETPFEAIPIFPVLGDEYVVDKRTRYHSAIRDARDAQRSYNYWRTAAAEAVALSPKAPFMISEKQIKGHETEWEAANVENLPFLTYNETERGTPPMRQPGTNPAAAELANATQDSADMQAIIGLHDASLGAESNEKSGKAILARQAQGSTSTYTFPANLNRAIEAMGRVLVSAIPRIYNTARVVRVRMPDDTEDFVELNKAEFDDEKKKLFLVHDTAYGKYDVVVDTGPSYATQRQEAIDSMLALLDVIPPEIAGTVVHLVVKNMGFPGADEIATILRKNLPDNLKSEEDRAADLPKGVVFDENGQMIDEKSGEPWEQPLSPAEQVQAETNQLEKEKLEVERLKAQGDMAKAKATIAKAEADQAKASADLAAAQAPPAAPESTGPDLEELRGDIERIISEAFARHEQNPGAHRDAIEAAAAEAVVGALRKVKGYVDQRIPLVSTASSTGGA